MKAVVLAAGKGKRLMSEQFNLPKVLRKANGRSLLSYVLENITFIEKENTIIVAGYMREKVVEEIGNAYKYAVQEEQLGTGHAVAMARDYFYDYDGDVLVLYGDMPLIKKDTYINMINEHKSRGNICTILTCVSEQNLPYGRIIKDDIGNVTDIIEEKDCTPEQKAIKELNVGVYVFNAKFLFSELSNLKNNNVQGEYYLTGVPKLLAAKGERVGSFPVYNETEITGVNTPEDLEFVENALKNGF